MFAKRKNRREPILECQVRDLLSLLDEDRVRCHDDGVGVLLLHLEKTAADILNRRCLHRQGSALSSASNFKEGPALDRCRSRFWHWCGFGGNLRALNRR